MKTMLLLAMLMFQDTTTTTNNISTFNVFEPQRELRIMGKDATELVVITLADGSVKFGKDYKADEASTRFWKALAGDSPYKRIAELEAKVKALEQLNAVHRKIGKEAYAVLKECDDYISQTEKRDAEIRRILEETNKALVESRKR